MLLGIEMHLYVMCPIAKIFRKKQRNFGYFGKGVMRETQRGAAGECM